jgi:hypothetical protein
MSRSLPSAACGQSSCEACPSAAHSSDCSPEEGMSGGTLVAGAVLAFLLPVGLACSAALWAGPAPAGAVVGGLGGFVAGSLIARPLLRRLESRASRRRV